MKMHILARDFGTIIDIEYTKDGEWIKDRLRRVEFQAFMSEHFQNILKEFEDEYGKPGHEDNFIRWMYLKYAGDRKREGSIDYEFNNGEDCDD